MRNLLIGFLLLASSDALGNRFYQHLRTPDYECRAERVMQGGFEIRGYETFPLTAPVDWSADPHRDTNWRYQLNAMYPLGPLFQGLAEGDRPDWRHFARGVFLDWIDFNITRQRPNPFKWNDMATGVRASYLAQLIAHERKAADIPAADLERLVTAGRLHVVQLSDPERFAEYNHGIFQMVGIAALCEVESYSECDRAVPYARKRYGHLFGRQFNVEGMHLEHSPAYHLLALRVFTRIEQSGLLELDPARRDQLEAAKANLHWLIHPDGGFAEFGDTEAASASGAGSFDPRARWLVSEGKSGSPAPSGLAVFPATGYAFARLHAAEGSSYLALTVAHHSRIHKHGDTFSFEWSDRGRRVLVDSGKWAYDEAPERHYVTSPRAHNTVVLEGSDFSPGREPEALPALQAEQLGELAVIRASGRHAPGRFYDTRQDRLLVLNPGNWLIVSDEASSLWPRTAVQWFQLPPEADVRPMEKGFAVQFPWTDAVLRVFSLVPLDGVAAHRGEKGEDVADWYGWYSPQYRKLQPGWQIGFRSSGFTHEFATVFRWTDAQDPVPLVDDGDDEQSSLCWLEGQAQMGVRVLAREDVVSVAPCG